ncbi:MAG: hypothetical protein Q8R26_00220 [bacterium]|nr:hypothetical protein [bacterium]
MFLLIILPLSARFFLMPPRAFAQEELKSALKEVTEKIGAISDIQDNNALSQKEKDEKELTARKEALSKIFDLTILEDKDLEARLNSLKKLSKEHEAMRTSFLGILQENNNAYIELRKRLETIDSVDAVKQLALDFKDWRTAVYNPKVEQIIIFTLIFREKQILATARDRFTKIESDLEKLEGAKLLKREDTADALKKIENTLLTAEILHTQAQQLGIVLLKEKLDVYINASTGTTTPVLDPKATTTISIGFKKEPYDLGSVKVLLEESLRQIKLTYAQLVEVANVVKAKIGL